MGFAEQKPGGPSQTAALRSLLAHGTLEATPKQVADVSRWGPQLPAQTAVYVPLLPGKTLADSVVACRTLAQAGLRPVPHVAARAIPSREALDGVLRELVDLGVDSLLLIAGDAPRPAGPFANTLDVLDSGLLARHGLGRMGIAGHPDGHPAVDDARLQGALQFKLQYARETGTELWLVTQFTFGSEGLFAWERRLRDVGIQLPIWVGLPGPTKLRTLMSYALQCGVGASARLLARRPEATKLLERWTPDPLVEDIAAYQAREPESAMVGLHLFPFGGLQASLTWLQGRRERVGLS
ncbi:MAG: methylenetetrahydrofolate reductase [Candidatus Competibacterales bacterium]